MPLFNLFRKKSEKEKLEIRYKQILKEAHALSKYNRRKSDEKYAEADQVIKEIESIELNHQN